MSATQTLPTLWRRRVTLLLTAVATFAAVAATTFALPKVYTSQAYLLVIPSDSVGSDFAATQLTQILTKTYSELLETDSVADAVDARLGTQGAGSAVSVTAVPQSQLLAIEAEAESPREAQRLANAYAAVFIERLERMADAEQTAGTVSLAEAASPATDPTRPRPLLYLTLGALLAALAGVAAALVRDRLDQRISVDSATTEVLGLPIIGRLPRGAHRPTGRAALAESASLLLANLTFAGLGRRPASVAVVSASEEEGKSTCTLSLGRAAAEIGIETLIVEADLRRPGLVAKLESGGRPAAHGFSTALLRPGVPIAEQVVSTGDASLDVLASGPLPPNPGALLGSHHLAEFDRQARAQYDLVVYDTPPFSAGADAALVSSIAEAVLLVVDVTRARRPRVVQAVEQLRRARANVLGVVINRADDAVEPYYRSPQHDVATGGSTAEPPSLTVQDGGREPRS